MNVRCGMALGAAGLQSPLCSPGPLCPCRPAFPTEVTPAVLTGTVLWAAAKLHSDSGAKPIHHRALPSRRESAVPARV